MFRRNPDNRESFLRKPIRQSSFPLSADEAAKDDHFNSAARSRRAQADLSRVQGDDQSKFSALPRRKTVPEQQVGAVQSSDSEPLAPKKGIAAAAFIVFGAITIVGGASFAADRLTPYSLMVYDALNNWLHVFFP